MSKARYIMIGGFLGAGKTTALAALAEHLTKKGLRLGLITNDQGSELVDTAMLRSKGFATEEIPGGCFCCRFHSLVDAVKKLDVAASPEVYLAEPVGSCTDLVATVTYPLQHLYGDAYTIAPVSVMVDPVRAESALGLTEGGGFSEKVLYIYRKQLEEADLIVIAKTDTLDAARHERLRARLAAEFPAAKILGVSVRTGQGVKEWFALLEGGTQGSRDAMEVDYEIYAEGEALLGWLNATVSLSHPEGIDPEEVLASTARQIQHSLGGAEIGHLKMALKDGGNRHEVAVINLVRTHFVPEMGQRFSTPVQSGTLTINLRAETAPEELKRAVEEAVAALGQDFTGLGAQLEHLQYFRPGKPEPTHRITSLTTAG